MKIGVSAWRQFGQRLGIGRDIEYQLKHWNSMLAPSEGLHVRARAIRSGADQPAGVLALHPAAEADQRAAGESAAPDRRPRLWDHQDAQFRRRSPLHPVRRRESKRRNVLMLMEAFGLLKQPPAVEAPANALHRAVGDEGTRTGQRAGSLNGVPLLQWSVSTRRRLDLLRCVTAK